MTVLNFNLREVQYSTTVQLLGGKDNLTRAILFIIYAYETDASLPVNGTGRHRKIREIKQSIRGFGRYQGKCWMNGS